MSDRGWSMGQDDVVENISGLWQDVDGIRTEIASEGFPSDEELKALSLKWNSYTAEEQEKKMQIMVFNIALRDKHLNRALYQILEFAYEEEEEEEEV